MEKGKRYEPPYGEIVSGVIDSVEERKTKHNKPFWVVRVGRDTLRLFDPKLFEGVAPGLKVEYVQSLDKNGWVKVDQFRLLQAQLNPVVKGGWDLGRIAIALNCGYSSINHYVMGFGERMVVGSPISPTTLDLFQTHRVLEVQSPAVRVSLSRVTPYICDDGMSVAFRGTHEHLDYGLRVSVEGSIWMTSEPAGALFTAWGDDR